MARLFLDLRQAAGQRKGRVMTSRIILTLSVMCCSAAALSDTRRLDIGKIVEQSAQATDADRKASSDFAYSETDSLGEGATKTYAVQMLLGSPYQQLVAVNGKPLANPAQERERQKLKHETSRREQESADQRRRRVAAYQKEQNRDRRFIEEFTRAFDFTLLGEQELDGRAVYLLQATPRAGYHPTDKASAVLTGMRGRLWIDKQTYQWVKVEAEVTRPVSMGGFLAKVERGTRFELEKMPVEGNIWLPKHFVMTSRARVLSLIPYRKDKDETYFNYHKTAQESGRPR